MHVNRLIPQQTLTKTINKSLSFNENNFTLFINNRKKWETEQSIFVQHSEFYLKNRNKTSY